MDGALEGSFGRLGSTTISKKKAKISNEANIPPVSRINWAHRTSSSVSLITNFMDTELYCLKLHQFSLQIERIFFFFNQSAC